MPDTLPLSPPTPSPSPPVSTSRYCTFSGLAQTASSLLRTAQFDGNEYLVVPVIALVGNSVVRPLGSTAPEFVPESALAQLPQQWNNRPVVLDHPNDGSANRPEILESSRFGHIFNARYEDGKLKFEAYLSRDKASKVGLEAEKLLSTCESGGMVEISIGAWVTLTYAPGTSPTGKPYDYVWSDIVSDHLAFLSTGHIGACSNEMGCGAPRLMKGNEMDNQEQDDKSTDKKEVENKKLDSSLASRIVSALSSFTSSLFRSQEMSDVELRDRLYTALRTSEPGFDWVVRIWPESRVFIYTTFAGSDIFYWKRSYTIEQEGTSSESLSLADDRVQVSPPDGNNLDEWRVVEVLGTSIEEIKAAGSDNPETRVMKTSSCGCGNKDTAIDDDSNRKEKGDLSMAENEDKEKSGTSPTPPQTPPPDPKTEKELATSASPKPKTVELSEDEYQRMKRCADAYEADQAAKKKILVSQLRAAGTKFTDEILNTFPIEHLEILASDLKVSTPAHDYSVKGLASSPNEPSLVPLPDPWGLNKSDTSTKGAN